MKKILSSLLIVFAFMFIGTVSVSAIDSSFSKQGKNYKYSWKDLSINDYTTYRLECNGNQIGGEGGNNNGNINFSNGYVLLETTNSVLTCKITNGSGEVVTQNSINTSNTTTTKTPETTQTTQQQNTTITQAKSNNNNIRSLNITGDDGNDVVLSPSFKSDVYEYSATVASTVRMVDIVATLEDEKANMVMSNNANEELVAGENNKITITVTAEDGSKKAYVLNIKREALTADATLKELNIKEDKDFKLKEDKFTYTVKIGKNVNKLTITYTLSDENASVEIEDNKNLKDGSVVKVIVTAEDGTKKVYTLKISKETETKSETPNIEVEKNPLIIMGLSIIAFGLIGGIIYVIKK